MILLSLPPLQVSPDARRAPNGTPEKKWGARRPAYGHPDKNADLRRDSCGHSQKNAVPRRTSYWHSLQSLGPRKTRAGGSGIGGGLVLRVGQYREVEVGGRALRGFVVVGQQGGIGPE